MRGHGLLNTHPDYMAFHTDKLEPDGYPVEYYQGIRVHVVEECGALCRQAVPRDVAAYIADTRVGRELICTARRSLFWNVY